jgi:2-oxo-4-hydroxy-4-carboxy-5-ureidoimidazoline decarboxylase
MASPPRPLLKELLAKPSEEIVSFLAGIYEHSPWVAEALVAEAFAAKDDLSTTITTISQLAATLRAIVDAASPETKLILLRAHPDLSNKVNTALTAESQEEQSKGGLQSMSADEVATFTKYNDTYKAKFSFPFILAVRNATKYTVLTALEGRVNHSVETELATALQQVHKIAWMRLLAGIDTSDAQGFLTCHVLDTAIGCPADNMRITLVRQVDGASWNFRTNADGRLEGGPALKGGAEMQVGRYEWTFHVGDYFCSKGTYIAGTPFLDVVPLQFGIDNPDDHYHVPLLVSPWSYSTYRGS